MTVDGTGSANSGTRSTACSPALASTASIRSSTIRRIDGRSALTRRTVKLPMSMRRWTSCSGGSMPTRAVSLVAAMRGTSTGKSGRDRSEDSRRSTSSRRVSAWPVTTQATRPS